MYTNNQQHQESSLCSYHPFLYNKIDLIHSIRLSIRCFAALNDSVSARFGKLTCSYVNFDSSVQTSHRIALRV